MVEQEVIEGKITRAQQVLDRIESPDFSQKRFLRLDQDISDREQAAQFLGNYARVGLIKERLLEKAIPQLEAEVERVSQAGEEGRLGELAPSRTKLVFFPDQNQIELEGRMIVLSQKERAILQTLAGRLNEVVRSRDLSREALDNPDPVKISLRRIVDGIKAKINPKDGPQLLSSVMRSAQSGYKLEGVEVVWPEEAQGEIIPEEGPVDGGATTIVAFPPDEILVVPYEPSEDEVRSEEENKILQFIVDILSRNRNFTFEDLQKAVYSESRVRRLAVGKRQIPIYQASELKDMFVSALRKFREEAVILSLRETWSDDEIELWGNLQLVARRISGDDWESFSRTVRARIDGAQRTFYSSLPEEERSRRILWIDL